MEGEGGRHLRDSIEWQSRRAEKGDTGGRKVEKALDKQGFFEFFIFRHANGHGKRYNGVMKEKNASDCVCGK